MTKLCVLKKSMLDKMFPKGVPCIRRFVSLVSLTPWEQRKLGSYIKRSQKKNLTYGRDRIISVAHMYFNPLSMFTEDDYLKTYNVMRLGDITFAEEIEARTLRMGVWWKNNNWRWYCFACFQVFRPIRPFDLMYWKYSINNEKKL